MKEYTDPFIVRFKPGDRDKIRAKMEEAGITNMAAFIRKMALEGYVIHLDLTDVKEVSRLLRINANNINQCAKRANETGNVYYGEIKRIQSQQDQLWMMMKAILQRLSTV